jgi:hypothetical protein
MLKFPPPKELANPAGSAVLSRVRCSGIALAYIYAFVPMLLIASDSSCNRSFLDFFHISLFYYFLKIYVGNLE